MGYGIWGNGPAGLTRFEGKQKLAKDTTLLDGY
jgi:hypothetical protein